MTAEEWRVVPGYDGAYEVSDLGRVRSWKTHGNTKVQRAAEPHLLKASLSSTGYPSVRLSEPGAYSHRRVHQMVMELFVGPRPAGMHIAHGDGIKSNNALTNLRYATVLENNRDKILHGTSGRGEKHNMAKLTEAEAIEIIRRLDAGERTSTIAADYVVTQRHISAIARGDAWGHLPADLEARARAVRTCPHGHALTSENVLLSFEKGTTVTRCRTCQRANERACRERRRQAAA